MGYTKIIQSGLCTEIYQYEKNHVVQKHKIGTRRSRQASVRRKQNIRTGSSIQRAKTNFFRLVESNLERDRRPLFLTLTVFQTTTIKDAYVNLKAFARKLRKFYGAFEYISVPEWQPVSGKIHFHMLVFSELPKWDERVERNFQRLYLRGYVDSSRAYDSSPRIASYMAKYMAKALQDERLGNQRAFSSSHGIKRSVSTGSNSLDQYADMILSPDDELVHLRSYDTMYLGRCVYKKLKRQ